MNMPRFTDGADWTMTPTKSTMVPSDTHARRPSRSARYEAGTYVSIYEHYSLEKYLTEKQSTYASNVVDRGQEPQGRAGRISKICTRVSQLGQVNSTWELLTLSPWGHCLESVQKRAIISIDCRS